MIIPIVLVFLLNQARANGRIALMKNLFVEEDIKRLQPTFTLERGATFFWMLVHFLIVCRSRLGNTIVWSGITYRVKGRQDVVVVARNEAS